MAWIVKVVLTVLMAVGWLTGPPPATASPWHLVLSQTGAQVASWPQTQNGYDCTTPGTVSVSGGSAALHVDGSTGQCAEVTYTAHAYAYGRFQARVYLPGVNGKIADWPAFWMVGLPENLWPAIGENDIAEGLNGQVCPGFHGGTPSKVGTTGNHCQAWVRPGWHTFMSQWGPGYVTWFYDGRQVLSIHASYITSAPEVLRFDITTGKYGLLPGVPATMLISSVKVWQTTGGS